MSPSKRFTSNAVRSLRSKSSVSNPVSPANISAGTVVNSLSAKLRYCIPESPAKSPDFRAVMSRSPNWSRCIAARCVASTRSGLVMPGTAATMAFRTTAVRSLRRSFSKIFLTTIVTGRSVHELPSVSSALTINEYVSFVSKSRVVPTVSCTNFCVPTKTLDSVNAVLSVPKRR